MATREASQPSFRTEDLLNALPSVPKSRIPKRKPDPVPKETDYDGSSSSDDEDDITKKLREVIATGVAKKRDEVRKAQLKLLTQHQKAINHNHDWRCAFINKRTCARCEEAKSRDSKYCKNHKNYIAAQERKARRDGRPPSPAPYPPRDPDHAETRERVNNLKETTNPSAPVESDAQLEARMANLRQGAPGPSTNIVPLSDLLIMRQEIEMLKKQVAAKSQPASPKKAKTIVLEHVDVTNNAAPVTPVQPGPSIAPQTDAMQIDNIEAHEEAIDANENNIDLTTPEINEQLDQLNKEYFDDANMQE